MPDSPPVFTIEEANALLPRLKALVGAQMDRRWEIERGLERLAQRIGTAPDSVRIEDSDPLPVRELKRDLIERVESYRAAWREVEGLGVVLKTPDEGLSTSMDRSTVGSFGCAGSMGKMP